MANGSFSYDVAFSFLDRDESTAVSIAKLLEASHLTPFVYSERQADLVGNDGADAFSNVLARDARVVVVLYREQWGKTKWTRIEETAIKNRVLDDGADFLTFVHFEKGKPTPAWLPATRIWLDFDRLGVEGAAAVIEERIRTSGVVAREETVEENAARLVREQAENARRTQFLASTEGVQAANTAIGELFDRIEGLREAADFTPTRAPDGIAIYRKGWTVQIVWRNQYLNTLRDSQLTIQEWDGRPDFGSARYAHIFDQPKRLVESVFMFDVVNDGEMGFRETRTERFCTTRALADLAVTRLLELVRAGGGARSDWA